MNITLDLIELNATDEYLSAFVGVDALSRYLGVEVNQIEKALSKQYTSLSRALCDSVAQLFIENGVHIADMTAISLVFGVYKDNEPVKGVYSENEVIKGVLVVAGITETNPENLILKLNDTLDQLEDGVLHITKNSQSNTQKVAKSKSEFKAYSFIGTLKELEDMVVLGLFDDFVDTILYKNGDKYELVATGPSDSVAVGEYIPKALNSHWKALYGEHRVKDCMIKEDAVDKIRLYCNSCNDK